MYQFNYTCEVICADGVLRQIPRTGYFSSYQVFNRALKTWDGCCAPNGGVYRYYEMQDDLFANALALPLPASYKYPMFSVLYNGPHQYEFVN